MEMAHAADDHIAVSTRAPRWALWAAYAVPLCLLPSSVWRVQLVATTGLAGGGWYLVVLSVAEMSLGLLTLGLVHSWGEVLPRWVPLLGGRRIPVSAAVVPATIGAVGVTLLCTYGVLNGIFHWVRPETLDQARSLSAFDVPANTSLERPGPWVAVAYAPLLAWGPLLAAVTWAYYRRRRHPQEHPSGGTSPNG